VTVYRRPDPIPIPRRNSAAELSSLGPIRAESEDLHHLVARQIFVAIASGKLPEGAILPNEHTLSREMGVSRTALREAIKGLASKGLVETRRRRGTQALDRSRWNMLDSDVVRWSRVTGSSQQVSQQLWRAVSVTQPALAGLAASRRDSRGVRLAAIPLQETAAIEDLAAHFANFHVEIAKAAANPFLTSLIVSCLDNLLQQDAAMLEDLARSVDAGAYMEIADRIEEGQIDAAERQMRRLLEKGAESGRASRDKQALETRR
jgi:DNA-binding FadR family transcriptional regulator